MHVPLRHMMAESNILPALTAASATLALRQTFLQELFLQKRFPLRQ